MRGEKNLHYIDSVLIGAGFFSLFVAGMSGIILLSARTSVLERALGVGLIALPIALLVAGFWLRRKENQVIAVWELLERTLECSVRELSVNTGFSREFILQSMRTLNKRGLTYFVWDDTTDTIRDARLNTELLVVETCPTCGATIGERVPAGLHKVVRCRHCDTPVSASHLNELKLKLLEQLHAKQPAERPPFSLGLFVFLIIFFWPGAVLYAYKRSSSW